jgi:hypothetical protein
MFTGAPRTGFLYDGGLSLRVIAIWESILAGVKDIGIGLNNILSILDILEQ